MNPRFFTPLPLPRPPADATVDLGEDAARHMQVLRLNPGDAITLFDGRGGEFPAVIADLGKKTARVSLFAHVAIERESPLAITLVQALATGDKMDLIVQKAVELGVAAIQPVTCERATLKLTGERADKRLAHWQGVVEAACEQCGRNRLPAVAPVMTLEAWLARPREGEAWMLDPRAATPLPAPSGPLSLLVGPEGGFSEREQALARKAGVLSATLGPRVLRTETAGLAAIAVLNARAGDFR